MEGIQAMTTTYRSAYKSVKNEIMFIIEHDETWGHTFQGKPYLDQFNLSEKMLSNILYQLDRDEHYIELGAYFGFYITYHPFEGRRKELFFVTKYADNFAFKNYFSNDFTNEYAQNTTEYDECENCHLKDKYDFIVINKNDFQNISSNRLKKSAGVIFQTDDLNTDQKTITELKTNHVPVELLDQSVEFDAHEILHSNCKFFRLSNLHPRIPHYDNICHIYYKQAIFNALEYIDY